MLHHRRVVVGAAAGIYGLALLTIGLWPSHVDDNLRLGGGDRYATIEFCANVALFAPMGVLGMLWSRRVRWSWVVLAALVVSSAVEGVQAIARPGRTADLSDVVANTSGAALGAFARRAVAAQASPGSPASWFLTRSRIASTNTASL